MHSVHMTETSTIDRKQDSKNGRRHFDSAWKEILDIYFKEFMAYCWLNHYETIDWDKPFHFLDQELQKINREAAIGRRTADKLIAVSLKNGQDALVLIHLEIQSQQDQHFAERMLVYRYRIRDRYKTPIASLAILLDSNPNWRPTFYQETLWGSSLSIEFPIIKFLDYKPCIPELEKSDNPFAAVILGQLSVFNKNHKNPAERLITKIALSRHLHAKGFIKKEIANLYRFLDWVLDLPKELELEYSCAMKEIEREGVELEYADYITTAELYGIKSFSRDNLSREDIKRGWEQRESEYKWRAMQEGAINVFMHQLKIKFKEIPEEFLERIEDSDTDDLMRWSGRMLESKTLEAIFDDYQGI